MDKYLNFNQFLAGVHEGSFHEELTEKLTDLVGRMSNEFQDNGGKPKAKITITLDMKLDGGVFEITPDVKIKEPPRARSKAVFWATPDNRLTKVNPRQGNLPLHDVSPIRREIEA